MRAPSGSRRRDAGLSLVEVALTLALVATVTAAALAAWAKTQEAYFAGVEAAEVQQNLRAALDFMGREIRGAGRDATMCAFDFAAEATRDCDAAKVARCAARLAATGTPAWEDDNGSGPGCAGIHAIPFADATVDTLRIRADRNHNGRIAGRANALTAPASARDAAEEDVRYAVATSGCPPGVSRCITRDDGTGAAPLVAVDVDGLAFTYYPRAGAGPCAGVAGPCAHAFALPLTSQADADVIGRIRIAVRARGRTAGPPVSRTLATEVTLRSRS